MAEHLHKSFGDRVLIDDLSFELPRNGIVGVIGPNGVGKSTLFKTIVGLEQPTSRQPRGRRDREDLLRRPDAVPASIRDKNLWEVVSGGTDYMHGRRDQEVPSRAYVAAFGFKGKPTSRSPPACSPAASATA